jgi:hypothetical protein
MMMLLLKLLLLLILLPLLLLRLLLLKLLLLTNSKTNYRIKTFSKREGFFILFKLKDFCNSMINPRKTNIRFIGYRYFFISELMSAFKYVTIL